MSLTVDQCSFNNKSTPTHLGSINFDYCHFGPFKSFYVRSIPFTKPRSLLLLDVFKVLTGRFCLVPSSLETQSHCKQGLVLTTQSDHL